MVSRLTRATTPATLVALVVSLLPVLPVDIAQAQEPERHDVSGPDGDGPGYSDDHALSDLGDFMVYYSSPDGAGSPASAWVEDLETGLKDLLTDSLPGSVSAGITSFETAISGDANAVAISFHPEWICFDPCLILYRRQGDDHFDENIYEEVALDLPGTLFQGPFRDPSIDAEGERVTFDARWGDAPGQAATDVFVRDTSSGTTIWASLASDESQNSASSPNSNSAEISGNGSFVVFESNAPNFDPADTDTETDIFVRNLDAGTTDLISEPTAAGSGSGFSFSPTISNDGRFVAFVSSADLTGDSGSDTDVFLADTSSGDMWVVTDNTSIDTRATPALSGDGQVLVDTDESTSPHDIVVYDVELRQEARRLSAIEGNTGELSINGSGDSVGFSTTESPLQGPGDVYVWAIPIDTGGHYAVPREDLYGTRKSLAHVADPVNTAMGNFVEQKVDLDFPSSVYGLDFSRHYNSQDGIEGPLGRGWKLGHQVQILDEAADGSVTIRMDNGRHAVFTFDGSNYQRPDEVYAALVKEGDESFRLDFFDGQVWDFGTDGELAEMAKWDGQTVTITQGADGPTQISSSTGYSVDLTYDGSGRLTSAAGSDGRSVSYTYDTAGLLASVTDTDGGVTTFSYNSEGLLETITDPEGVVVVDNTYDGEQRVVSQTDAGGEQADFVYDDTTGETAVTFSPSGEIFTYQHDPQGRIISITDPNGEQVSMSRRADGELTGATSRLGEGLTQSFDDNGNVLSSETTTGGETTYSYDSQDRLISVTEPWGATTTYSYDASERIPTTVTDPLGNTTTLDVVDGLVESVTDPDGVTTSFSYSSQRLLGSETNGAGDTTTYSYDGAGRVTSITTPLGNETTFTYDGEGRLLSSTDPTGATTTYSYDEAGRLVSVTDPEGATTTHSYDSAGRLASTTDSRGAVTTFDYDAFDQLVTTTRPGGATTTNTWEELGRLAAMTDPVSRTTGFGYDVDGNRTSTTDPTGDTTTTNRDSAGRVTSVTDPLGRTTSHAYDSSGRLSSTTDPAGAVTSFSYDDLGRTETITDPRGGETTTSYTGGGRVASVTDPNGDTISYTYDDAGRLATVTDPEGGVTSYTYDADGRIAQVETPEGLATTTGYDAAGRPTEVTDPAGVTTSFSYNDRGDLVQTQRDGEGPRVFSFDDRDLLSATDPLGSTTTFEYDDRGNRTSMTDALGRTQTATFADDDQRTSVTDALDRTTTVSYDGDGRVETVADPSGRTVTNSYDAAGQLVSQAFADGFTISYTYGNAGRRASMTDPTGTTSYSYDESGNLISVSYPNGDSLEYAYDVAGRRTQVTYPDGSTVDYAYDDNGRLSSVTHSDGGSAAYSYDQDGRLLSETLSDGTTRTYSYTDGRLTSYTQNGDTTTVSYDPSGRISSTSGAEAWTFGYDAAGQLTSAEGPSGSHAYSYDQVGNLVTKDGVTLTVDDANQLVSDSDGASYSYDDAGRLTEISEADGTIKSYAYDSRGLLTEEKITTPGGGGEPDPGEDVCANATPTLVGTEGDDELSGGSGNDVIFGLGGNDIIDAGSGSDIVCGGDGDDQIIGGSGVDELIGGSGNDTIDAGPGVDTVYGGPGADIVDGDSGADSIFGWGGEDVLSGGTGADEIDGEAGTDAIDGGTGSDTCETEPTRVNCEQDLESTGGGGGSGSEETVISRTYDGDGILTSVTITHADETVDDYQLTWDRTLPIPQIIEVTHNGEATNLVYGVNRAFGTDASGTTGYAYSVLGDIQSGPLSLGGRFDPYGLPDNPDRNTIGFGYRGELHLGTDVYLRFRYLDPTSGRYLSQDLLAGIVGTTTVANAYSYASNEPIGKVDPLGLRSRDADLRADGANPEHETDFARWVRNVGGFFKGLGEGVVEAVQGTVEGAGTVLGCFGPLGQTIRFTLQGFNQHCSQFEEGVSSLIEAFVDEPAGTLKQVILGDIIEELATGNPGEAWGRAVLLAAELVLGPKIIKAIKGPKATNGPDGFVDLTTPQRRTHILYGDETGGGHLWPGQPGKTPFPQDWSADRVIHEISDVATDPLSVKATFGSQTVVTGVRDGVDIRVVINNATGEIITGYPTNLPRNP